MSTIKQVLVLLICVVLLSTPSLGDHHKPPPHGHKPAPRHKPPTLDGHIPDDHRFRGGKPRHGPQPPLVAVDQRRKPTGPCSRRRINCRPPRQDPPSSPPKN
ncbi:hypothetical protein LguiB_014157 [Lonicera macranthoides]